LLKVVEQDNMSMIIVELRSSRFYKNLAHSIAFNQAMAGVDMNNCLQSRIHTRLEITETIANNYRAWKYQIQIRSSLEKHSRRRLSPSQWRCLLYQAIGVNSINLNVHSYLLKHSLGYIFEIFPSEKASPNSRLIGDHHNGPSTESGVPEQGRDAWTEGYTSWIAEVVAILNQDAVAIEK